MSVNLAPPDPRTLSPIAGVELGTAMAGVKQRGRRDVLLVRLAAGTQVAAVFTQNPFCAAPVVLARRHLASGGGVRALVVNTGNANAGTGDDGMARAMSVCDGVARQLGCVPDQVLPFSTGVIMEPLPADRIVAALPAARADLGADHWDTAARAIMTTDTVPKAASCRVRLSGGEATVTGIAKGAGMIRPDMATMLAFVATDARVPRDTLDALLRDAAGVSFNSITVDGDTSTNDAFILMATGAGPALAGEADRAALARAINEVSIRLAQAIVRDGEGATKFVTVQVENGRSVDEARRVAYAIAHSPLVKTAFFASDPNLGRILAAIGNAGVDGLDIAKVEVHLDDVPVAAGGARLPDYREDLAAEVMRKPEFTVRAVLGRGQAGATVWTCDLSFDYVKINAEYRT